MHEQHAGFRYLAFLTGYQALAHPFQKELQVANRALCHVDIAMPALDQGKASLYRTL
ncbi:hypothetical protein D3C84_949640 [compost metagenome]